MKDDFIYQLAELSEKISEKFGDAVMCAICGAKSIETIKTLAS